MRGDADRLHRDRDRSQVIRDAMRFVSDKHRKKMAASMRTIYAAPTVEAAELALKEFESVRGTEHPGAIDVWQRAWPEFVPFLDYPVELRTIVYTTEERPAGTRTVGDYGIVRSGHLLTKPGFNSLIAAEQRPQALTDNLTLVGVLSRAHPFTQHIRQIDCSLWLRSRADGAAARILTAVNT